MIKTTLTINSLALGLLNWPLSSHCGICIAGGDIHIEVDIILHHALNYNIL